MSVRSEARNAKALQVAAWLGISVLFAAVQRSTGQDWDKPLRFLLVGNAVHFGIWALMTPLLAVSVRRFPMQRGQVIRHGLALLPICLAMTLLVSFLYPTVIFLLLSTFGIHVAAYPAMIRHAMDSFLQMDLLACVLLISSLHALRWWRALRSEQLRSAELESRLANANLAALRMQLHPHFLFNTLQSIAGLVTEDAGTARRMIIALGDFLRLTLEDGAAALRSLSDELEFARLYIAIEKMRLGDRMTVEYDIAPETTDALLPYLILQPLVENAIRHGAARVARPVVISLRAAKENGDLHLTLENDGPQISRDAARGFEPGVGVSNTLERLRMHYGNAFQFTLAHRSQGGCVARLTIPFVTATNTVHAANGQLRLSHSHR